MRKTIAIILCAALVMSMFVIGASAVDVTMTKTATATAINTPEEFAAMNPYGEYYLNSDLTLTATIEEPFFGVIYGNGKVITVSNPIFKEFNGQIADVTINGAITVTEGDVGALANYTEKGFTAVNVETNVNITVTAENSLLDNVGVGGLVGNGGTISEIVLRNCVNNGNIAQKTKYLLDETTGAVKNDDNGNPTNLKTYGGGFVGRCGQLDAKYCVNNGEIKHDSLSSTTSVGGIVGRPAYTATIVKCDIVDCTNNGEIFSNGRGGGMAGYIGVSGNDIYAPYSITYCTNTGKITGSYQAGSMNGYTYASGKNSTYYLEITYCVNTGDIVSGRLDGSAFCSPYVGYSNSVHNKIAYCVSTGSITSQVDPTTIPADDTTTKIYFVIMGCSSADTATMKNNCVYNYFADNNVIEWYTYAEDEAKNSSQRITLKSVLETPEQVNFFRCSETDMATGVVFANLSAAPEANGQFIQGAVGPELNPDKVAERKAAEPAIVFEVPVDPADTTPEVTTEEETNPPKTTTKAPDTTEAPSGDTTPAPSGDTTTAAPKTTTKAPADEGGCGGIAIAAQLIALFCGSIAFVAIRKKH